MRPEPGGSRRLPPPRPRTAIGSSGSSGELKVIVALKDGRERELFTKSFQRLGWNVETGVSLSSLTLESFDFGEPAFILTDEWEWIKVIRQVYTPFPKSDFVVLVDADEHDVAMAWDAGADWLVTRPIDPDDPLGFQDLKAS